MTNGEKLKEVFPSIKLYEKSHDAIQINFDSVWWSAEYKEPTGIDCIDRNSIKYYPGTGGYMYASKGEIDKLSSVTPQEPRWIPVSEYLPVTNDEVLVTYIVNGNTKKRYVETANCFDGEWSSVNDEYRIPNTKIEIIAWCEMPKPYKVEVEPQESEDT